MPEITEKQIAEDLIRIGFRPDNNGYYYMIEAVGIRLDDLTRNVGEIYKSVAESFNTNPTCVERAIRYSVRQIYNQDRGVWKGLGWQGAGKPPNRFAIAAIAERHRLGRYHENTRH